MRKQTSVITLPTRADQHDHGFHQLVFGLEGDTEFDLAGHCRPVTTGRGCLLPSSTGHAFYGLGENRIVVVNLPEQSDDREQQLRIEQLFRRPDYFNCRADLTQLLQVLSREMLRNPADSLLQDACGSTLVCALQRHLDELRQSPRLHGKLNLQLLDDYIDLHMERRISVAELAGCLCLSASQFYQRFRDQTGQTPQHYVLERRLQAVAQALLHNDLALSQLAEHYGFGNQSSLTRHFSRRFGLPPARYRREQRR